LKSIYWIAAGGCGALIVVLGNSIHDRSAAAPPGFGIRHTSWRRREFTAGQVERARVFKALHAKGATLSRLTHAN
jgi:hypothetical protein